MASLRNVNLVLLKTIVMKAAGPYYTHGPTTSEFPHLGLSTQELSSLPHPALAPLSLDCYTGTAKIMHHKTQSINVTTAISTTPEPP